MPLRSVRTSVKSRTTGQARQGTDRISLTSLPLLFENADIEVANRFATLVEDAELPHEPLFNDPNRAELDTYGM